MLHRNSPSVFDSALSFSSAACSPAVRRRVIAIAGVAVVIAAIWHWALAWPMDLLQFEHLTETLSHSGPWGPAVYMGILILSVVVSQIPGAPLAIAAGAIWDPFLAGLYTLIGGFGGALIAYGLGKHLGQSIVHGVTGKKLVLASQYSDTQWGWLIFATRLLPILSFDLISYGAGILKMPLPTYASATLFGMAPSTFLLAYAGNSVHLDGPELRVMVLGAGVLFILLPLLAHRLKGSTWTMPIRLD